MADGLRDLARSQINLQRPIIVLPCRAADVLSMQADAKWLKAATTRKLPPTVPLLERLLAALGEEPPDAGRAALRLWGQTGIRPTNWVAAADPVWMQAGLEKLVLHVPPATDIDSVALADMLADLQNSLLQDIGFTLEAHGVSGYLRGTRALPVAELPASCIDRGDPAAFMPAHGGAAAEYFALTSEMEMALFENAYNQQRERAGQRPLNALWLWGGGTVEGTAARELPLLYTDDDLLKGFAAFRDSHCEPWQGTLAACVDADGRHFVAAPAHATLEEIRALLEELRIFWQQRSFRSLLILFDDFAIELTRSWRSLFARSTRLQLEKIINER